MTLRPFMALWPYGRVVLWLHGLARPGASLGLARLLWFAGRAHTALVFRRSHAHGSSGPHVARTRLHWTAPPGDFLMRPLGDFLMRPPGDFLMRPPGDFLMHPPGDFLMHPPGVFLLLPGPPTPPLDEF